jgi:hypothetical protein
MPKPGYANFTIKEEAAKKFEELSRKSGMSLVALVNLMAEKVDPDIDSDTLLKALELAPSLKFSQALRSEALKIHSAQLYYYIEAMCSVAVSLLKPSPFTDFKLILIHKAWSKKTDPLTVLASAGLIDPSVGVISLIQNLENGKNALKKVLDSTWHNWRDEVKPPMLMSEFPIPNEYLAEHANIKTEVLREELKPFIDEVFKLWKEASELAYFLSTNYPELKELLWEGLEDFSKFFQLSERSLVKCTDKI